MHSVLLPEICKFRKFEFTKTKKKKYTSNTFVMESPNPSLYYFQFFESLLNYQPVTVYPRQCLN